MPRFGRRASDMKKGEVTFLIIGLISMILAVILSIVTCVVFTFQVKKELGKHSLSEGIEWMTNLFDKYVDSDSIVITGDDGNTIVDFSNGIHFDSGDGTRVDVNADGINVLTDGTEVSIG